MLCIQSWDARLLLALLQLYHIQSVLSDGWIDTDQQGFIKKKATYICKEG